MYSVTKERLGGFEQAPKNWMMFGCESSCNVMTSSRNSWTCLSVRLGSNHRLMATGVLSQNPLQHHPLAVKTKTAGAGADNPARDP